MSSNLKKSLMTLVIASAPLASNADWLANITIRANTTNAVYSDLTEFGVKTNATAGYDSTIDQLDPPATPLGVNTYQTLTNSANVLNRNYLGSNDIVLFRGAIEYNGITPTSRTATVQGLPDNNFTLLTFSDAVFSNRNGTYNLKNGIENKLTNTLSYIITKSPQIKTIVLDPASGNLNLTALFYSDGKVPLLDLKETSNLSSYTNSVGQLNLTSYGNYIKTNVSPSATKKFFRVEVP